MDAIWRAPSWRSRRWSSSGTGQPVRRGAHDLCQRPPPNVITHVTWTADEERVLASSFDHGNTTVFEADTGSAVAAYPNDVAFAEPASALPSPDGRFIAATDFLFEYAGPGTARIIDPDTLDEVATLRGSAPMAFSPDSSVLLVGDFGVGYVYEVGTWELLATLSDPDTRTFVNDIYADAHFLSDGKHVLTADDGVRPGAGIWDMQDWSVVGTVPLGEGTVYISSTTDGDLIALSRQLDGKAAIYRESDILEDVTEEAVPYWEIDAADNLLFTSLSPDGSLLATGGFDEHITFWDVSARERLYSIDMGTIPSNVEFSEDGRHLLVALVGITRLLTLDPAELNGLARDRATREMTEEECRFYLLLGARELSDRRGE